MHNDITGKMQLHRVSAKLRISGRYLGYGKSTDYARKHFMHFAKAKRFNFNNTTLWISISVSKYDKFKELPIVRADKSENKRLAKKRRNISYISHEGNTFIESDLKSILNKVKQKSATRHYQNIVLNVSGYGSISKNKGHLRLTDGGKLMLNQLESQLIKSLISPKIKTLFSYELYNKTMGKECGYNDCNKPMFICKNQKQGIKDVHVKTLKLCSRCKNQYYCCRKHQKFDWKSHKKNCFKQ